MSEPWEQVAAAQRFHLRVIAATKTAGYVKASYRGFLGSCAKK
jgi:hypothetical protein